MERVLSTLPMMTVPSFTCCIPRNNVNDIKAISRWNRDVKRHVINSFQVMATLDGISAGLEHNVPARLG